MTNRYDVIVAGVGMARTATGLDVARTALAQVLGLGPLQPLLDDERISEIFAGATHPFRSSWSVNAFASAKLGGHEIFG